MTTDAPQFGLSQIGQIAIIAHDVERATAFYRDKLGMRFLFSAPPGMSFFDCAGVRLMVSLPSEPKLDHPASIIYYRVDDIHAAHATLVARGVKFVQEPHLLARLATYDLWLAAFEDSEGNLLELMSEVPRTS